MPTKSLAEIKKGVIDVLMSDLMGIICVAAGRGAQVGAQFLWRLHGGFEGSWMMNLTSQNPGMTPLKHDGAPADGIIDWTLELEEVVAILRNSYDFAKALQDGRIKVQTNRVGALKLAKAFEALATVDLRAAMRDPQSYIENRSRDDVSSAQTRVFSAGVSIR